MRACAHDVHAYVDVRRAESKVVAAMRIFARYHDFSSFSTFPSITLDFLVINREGSCGRTRMSLFPSSSGEFRYTREFLKAADQSALLHL